MTTDDGSRAATPAGSGTRGRRVPKPVRMLTGILVATLATVLAGAPPASAHNVLISSSPAEGDQLGTPPETVTLTFDQPVQQAGTNEIAVTGPQGGSWAEGSTQVDGSTVTATLRPLGPAGEYVIGFGILSADGHRVSDEIRFTLTSPGPGATDGAGPTGDAGNTGTAESGAPPPQIGEAPESAVADGDSAGDDSAGISVWVWVVGAIALLTIGLAIALRMGRSHEE